MKILLFALLLYPSMQVYTYDLQAITKAIGAGDAKTLGSYFDAELTVSLPEKEGIYAREEAIPLVAGFFAAHPPQGFVQVHEGASKEGNARYCIGDLKTASGNYRVYLYMKVTGDKTLIQELRFDP
ncbi:MAG: DUF4783 domain-containing protein [Saprospiraceae bacterium]|nr:DUF4783 domain-containing protein [Saprospiraceae bacterium]MDP4819776.1 DUF4783 domain-containing protein [Saprospiraceae bacterium]MDP4998972.1 DUF4783 domain-containing protein [Saprospiraceae bacterium]